MDEKLQDEAQAKADLKVQARLEQERAPWENTFREVDERFPYGGGGFNRQTPGQIRGERNYDPTHVMALQRFAAAGVAITTPEERQYIRPVFADRDLMKIRAVQLWCERAGERLYAIRHAPHTGFGVAANEDWDQLGRYGTSPMWVDASARGLFYRTLHLSECFIDVDYAGQVNRCHRKFEKSVAQLSEMFGKDALTPKMLEQLEGSNPKPETKFEVLHIVAPNTDWDREKMDHRRFPISSRYLAVGEKIYLRRAGYQTMPISVSRHMTSAGEKYGRSPATDTMPTINGVNTMRYDTLRAGKKANDPALLFARDQGVTKLVTRPGGMNPGLVDEISGRPLVHKMPGGEAGIPYALEMIEQERQVVRNAFLEEFYKILTDPNSRMTTTEVLEVMSKQGVLVRPFANRYATEKQDPVSQRELDLAMRNGQIEPFPDEVVEAGAWPRIDYENPLAAMARAESTAKSMRYVEAITPLANIKPDVMDKIDADAMAAGMAEEIGVKPSYIRGDNQVAEIRAGREEAEAAAFNAEQLEQTAGATLDLAKAGQISRAA